MVVLSVDLQSLYYIVAIAAAIVAMIVGIIKIRSSITVKRDPPLGEDSTKVKPSKKERIRQLLSKTQSMKIKVAIATAIIVIVLIASVFYTNGFALLR
jgi:hypothetical protein